MLMLCWFYCIPFAKLLYFAISPLLVIFALFVLKRGIRLQRVGLRQAAFLLIFLSAVKVCGFDVHTLRGDILCGSEAYWPILPCNAKGFAMLQLLGIVVLFALSAIIFHFYRIYLPNRKFPKLKPEDVNLRFWANLSMLAVCAMMMWTMAPWVGYLTVGGVPAIFTTIKWQHFALVNLALLLVGFWKSESCQWEFTSDKKNKGLHTRQNWTPRDTLWLNIFLYLITLALSYVAHDVLTTHAK